MDMESNDIMFHDVKFDMATREISVVKPWEQLSLREKYNNVKWNNQSYYVGGGKIDEITINNKLGSITAIGVDELNNHKKHSIKCDVYSIKSVSSQCIVAIKYQGYKGYYPFINSCYTPATLGDFIKDLNLKENLIINNKIYYSYWKDDVIAPGNYITMAYSLPDPSVIWDLLLSDASIKNSGDEHYTNSLMDVSIDIKITGEKNAALSVNEDGYLQTNILGTGKSFYIGKKNVNEFVKYVKKHGSGNAIITQPKEKMIDE